MMINTPLSNKKHYLRFIESANTALAEPEKWCLDGECKDTNYGGKDRLHGRGKECPVTRPNELKRLIGVASERIREIDAVWSDLVAKGFIFLDDAQRAVYDHMCLSWADGGAYDIASLTVAFTERDQETFTYRVSVSFEEFWNTVPYYRRDVLKRNTKEAQDTVKRNKISDAVAVAAKGIRDLSNGVPVDLDKLNAAYEMLVNAAVTNGKESK